MGLSAFRPSSSPVSKSIFGGRENRGAPFFDPEQVPPGNPVPDRFSIVRVLQLGAYVVAEIQWPDATNYEGRKILVYRCTPGELTSAKLLDPHFIEHGGPTAPIARFAPTATGLRQALQFAEQENTAELREAKGRRGK
jgi:hypothetical protein